MKKYTHLIAAGLLLGALSPLKTQAQSQNTWLNTSGNFFWDGTSANWTSPTIWADGADAIFGATGAGNINLNAYVTADSLTFNAPGYTITGNANYLTLTNAGLSPITVNSSATIGASIQGTNGLAVFGNGALTLLGDVLLGGGAGGNQYTGGTHVYSGTVILFATNMTANTSWAVDSIQELGVGATVKIGTQNDGLDTATSNVRPPDGQLRRGNGTGGRLNLTGGTFDNNGDNNGINYPPMEGSGTIVNSSPYARGVMKLTGGSGTYLFTGSINDGGPTITRANSGPGYQENIDMNGGGPYTLELGGSNSFTGFLRLNSGINGNKVVLLPGGTLGYPAPINCPSRQILMNGGTIDLNGTSQNVGYVYTGNDVNSIITNSAIGTVSTLTVCYNCTNGVAYNGAATPRGIRCGLLDDPATGGTLALTKAGTAIQPIGDYPADNDTAMPNNYHGDTTVNNGILEACSVKAISPNSSYRLNGPGKLQLDFTGTVTIGQLYLNGVRQPAGIYGSAQTSLITGPGSLQVLPPNVWTDGAANSLWDLASANWTNPTLWSQGSDAIFNSTGASTVTLNNNITVENMTFNADGYVINGNGNALTVIDGATITRAANTTDILAAVIGGTNGLTYAGSGTSVIVGDPSFPLPQAVNCYRGGTAIHGGTVILSNTAAYGTGSSSPYSLDGVSALDTGATLMIPGVWNPGTGKFVGDNDQMAVNGQVAAFPHSFLHMTGGTLDFNNDAGNQHIPPPDGTGTIINSGSWSQSRVLINADGQDHSWYGVIADGNNGVLNGDNTAADNGGQGPGYQIGAIWLVGGTSLNGVAGGAAGPYQHWYWYGSNTCSASFRLDNGTYFKLMGPNANISNPTANGLTGPMRLYNGVIDLNGHNQTIALMTHGGNGIIQNTATGTVSTLTFGYGNEQVFSRWCGYTFQDNWNGGGILSLKKINTAPYAYPVVGTFQYMATNCVQEIRGTGGTPPNTSTAVCTYSGDTTLLGGGLILTGTSAVSPNSAYRLYTPNSYTLLTLNYTGTANVRQLWINGVQQPNGTYGAIGNSLGAIGVAGIDPASTGTLTVTGYAPVVLNTTQSGGNLNFTWSGVYKLQSKTNLVGGTWTDVAGGGTSPVSIPVDTTKKSVFYRLTTY